MHSSFMAKIVRPTYPKELSIGLLLLVFVVALFLSGQVFEIPRKVLNDDKNLYVGMVLLASSVVIMMLVLWEEFLFPVHTKPEQRGMVFRNHRSKLRKQVLIYLLIPAIYAFIYFEYEVNLFRYIIWAAICIIFPVVGKLVSGLKNYNDFLKLTDEVIAYKNNKKEGAFAVKDVKEILLIKDEGKVLHKFQVSLNNDTKVLIDLDEMEIEAFYSSIDEFITTHYKSLVK